MEALIVSDEELRHILTAGLAAMADAKGPCPSLAELMRYHLGEVAEPRAAEVAQHAVRCPNCDLLLDQIERCGKRISDQASTSGVTDDYNYDRPSGRTGLSAYWRPVLVGAIAASVLLAVPMFWLSRHRVQEAATNALAARGDGNPNLATITRVLVVPQIRTADTPALHLTGQEDSIVLSFFVPMVTEHRYEATIVRSYGVRLFAPIDISSEVETGNVSLNVRATLLTAGSYAIIATDSSQGKSSDLKIGFEVIR